MILSYQVVKDRDGTIKTAFDFGGPFRVEAVLLLAPSGRRTACLSTQIGCSMGCKFCNTGTLGFVRNLSSEEILTQYEVLSREGGMPSNVVFMGMPLENLLEVQRGIHLLLQRKGAPALRHITIESLLKRKFLQSGDFPGGEVCAAPADNWELPCDNYSRIRTARIRRTPAEEDCSF